MGPNCRCYNSPARDVQRTRLAAAVNAAMEKARRLGLVDADGDGDRP